MYIYIYIHIYVYKYIVTSRRQSNAPILLITTMALWRHAGCGRPVALSPQSHCGDEEDGRIGLSS